MVMWLMRTKDLTGNPQVLGVVVDVMKKTGVTEIQVSSLWRNSEGSPHKEGLGIDITAATRDGVTVRFNNSTVGSQSEEAMRIRDDIYNAFVSDKRVSQALDPWWLKSEVGKGFDFPNVSGKTPRIERDRYNFTVDGRVYRISREDYERWISTMDQHTNHLHITIQK